MKIAIAISIAILLAFHTAKTDEFNLVSIKGVSAQKIGGILLKEIYQRLGHQITILPSPAKRAEVYVKTGSKDGEVMRVWIYGVANPDVIRIPSAIFRNETTAFIRKNSGIQIQRPSDLTKYTCVKLRGAKNVTRITRNVPSEKVFNVDSLAMALKLLSYERVDIAIFNKLDGIRLIKKMKYTNIEPVEKPLDSFEAYHYLHKRHKELVPKLDAIIKEMKKTGELAHLTEKAKAQILAE